MARIQFTNEVLEGLPVPSAGRLYVHDAETQNLTFCVTATGSRSFYLYKRIAGRPERIHIGKFPDLTVEQARREVVRLSRDIARGINPQARKQAARRGMGVGRNADVPRVHFTKQCLEQLKPPLTGRTSVYDLTTPGLVLIVTATGHKSFYLYKRIAGRPERVHIGRFPDLTVEQARRKADELRGDIARGVNPADRKRTARGMMLFGELFDAYLDRAKLHKRTWNEDQRQFDHHLPGWKARPLASITRADVARLHAKIGKDAPYAANRLLALLSCVFNTAANDFGYEGVNPCRGVKKFREEKRDRFLLPDEMKRFFAALSDEPDDTLRDFFWTALLTGARRGNCQSMRWDELDVSRGDWRIPGDKSKNRESMLVHLPPQAVEILNRRLTDDAAKPEAKRSEWVFPSFGATGHLVETKSAWARIRTAAKLPGLRVHDLRRTLASWQAITGTSLHVIGKSLGHRTPSATAIYARLTQAPVSESVDRAAVAMLTAGGILPVAPIVEEQGGDNGK